MKQSERYGNARAELLAAEIELKEQRERVAELRRGLPLDTIVEDHVFTEALPGGSTRELRISELFDDPLKPLVLVHLMFGKKQEQPCPMCTMWADGYSGTVEHLSQSVNFGVLVAGDAAAFRKYADERGWGAMRIVSSGDASLKLDVGMETPDGAQLPGVSVFERDADGNVLHFYSACAMMGGGHFRGMDQLSPVWNFLDLTREGRGEFMPKRQY